MPNPKSFASGLNGVLLSFWGVDALVGLNQSGLPRADEIGVNARTLALTFALSTLVAVAQEDIKRVLAYSTVSQLGYMMLGIGVGGVAVGVFHLLAHAFFKALLFLGAGSVIHGLIGALLLCGIAWLGAVWLVREMMISHVEEQRRLYEARVAEAQAARAREARQKVEKAGLKTYTQEVETPDGKRIRVRVGPFATRAEADKAASKIKGLDLPASILSL